MTNEEGTIAMRDGKVALFALIGESLKWVRSIPVNVLEFLLS